MLEGVIDEEAWQLLQVAGRCEGEVQETRSHMRTISDQERQCCHDNDAKRTEVQVIVESSLVGVSHSRVSGCDLSASGCVYYFLFLIRRVRTRWWPFKDRWTCCW